MTTKLFLSACIVVALASCNDNRTPNKPHQDTPKALEDKSSSHSIISKRGSYDLVESLYAELVNKDMDLKRFEEAFNELQQSKSDTTRLFDKYNKKNQEYFSSAGSHVLDIKDSVLREKMKNLVAHQLTKYNLKIAKHHELLQLMEEKQITLSDLRQVLMLVRTLPLIDNYQKDNLPGTASFEGYIKEQEEAIQLADPLTKK
jgi:hypothetical protein